jgi:hypothetical protein
VTPADVWAAVLGMVGALTVSVPLTLAHNRRVLAAAREQRWWVELTATAGLPLLWCAIEDLELAQRVAGGRGVEISPKPFQLWLKVTRM